MKLLRCDNCGEEEEQRLGDYAASFTLDEGCPIEALRPTICERHNDDDHIVDLCPACVTDWDRKAERLRKEKANV